MDQVIATRRTPRDGFEVELFRREIRRALETWTSYDAVIGPYQDDGTWKLYLSPARPFDFATMLDGPQLIGRVWVSGIEVDEDVVIHVGWTIGDQTNWDYPPVVIDWEATHA